jgi:hypothetical protein
MSLYRLDVPVLYRLLDKQRAVFGWSWRKLGRELRISGSTFSRMAQGDRPDADALVTMFVWLAMDTDIVYVVTGDAE